MAAGEREAQRAGRQEDGLLEIPLQQAQSLELVYEEFQRQVAGLYQVPVDRLVGRPGLFSLPARDEELVLYHLYMGSLIHQTIEQSCNKLVYALHTIPLRCSRRVKPNKNRRPKRFRRVF